MLSQQCRLAAGTELQPQVRFGVFSCSRDMLILCHRNRSCDLESQLFLTCLVPKQCCTKDLSLKLQFISGLGPEQMFLFLEWIIVCQGNYLRPSYLNVKSIFTHYIQSAKSTLLPAKLHSPHLVLVLIEQILNCSKSRKSAVTLCKASTAPIQMFKVARK